MSETLEHPSVCTHTDNRKRQIMDRLPPVAIGENPLLLLDFLTSTIASRVLQSFAYA